MLGANSPDAGITAGEGEISVKNQFGTSEESVSVNFDQYFELNQLNHLDILDQDNIALKNPKLQGIQSS